MVEHRFTIAAPVVKSPPINLEKNHSTRENQAGFNCTQLCDKVVIDISEDTNKNQMFQETKVNIGYDADPQGKR
jgi:hypothetical protein